MTCTSFCLVYRIHLLVTAVVLGLVIAISIGIAWADDLEVAQIPAVDAHHKTLASEISSNVHVVIVGAGAAGMSAAYTLEYLGLNYTVLEAHATTVGGRVRQSTTFVDVPLDIGAEWIHVMPQVLQDLLLVQADKQKVVNEVEIMEYYADTASAYNPNKQKRKSRNFVGYFDSEFKFRSTTWFSYFENYFLPYIQDRIRLGAVVTEIRYNDPIADASSTTAATSTSSSLSDNRALQAMTVTTQDGREFSASHVIVTVPIPVLQDGDISFVPDFDTQTRQAIDDMEMAHGMKVYMEWSTDFYPDWQSTGHLVRGGEGEPLFFDAVWGKPTNRHVQCLFNVGPSKAVVEPDRTDEEIVQDTVALLEEIFDRPNLQPKQTMVQNWSQEPYIRGAYSWNYGEYDQALLRQPRMDGHLFLAGEHLAVGEDYYTSTVHGAAITGREAVLKILKSSASAGQSDNPTRLR